jgi:DNA-binding IclR family transcriptional regulator
MTSTTPPDSGPGPAEPGRAAPGLDTVLGKTVAILQAFSLEQFSQTFADLQRSTGLPKATLHRLLGDLVAARLLDRVDGRYRLSMLVFELGMRASVERSLLEVAFPFLEDLYERTHELVHLGVREGSEVLYIAKVGGHQQAVSPSRIGGRMPLHATAIGKVLLAHAPPNVQAQVLERPLPRRCPRTITSAAVLRKQLETTSTTGTAYEYEESAVGIVCVAAPVVDGDGNILAAISVTGPVNRFLPERHADAVRAAAAEVSATLARRRPTLRAT